MNIDKLSNGEKIAAGAGVALLVFMFLSWYSAGGGSFSTGGGLTVDVPDANANAWQAFSLIDLILFITGVAAIALGVMAANAQSPNLPVAMSAIVAGLGIFASVLVLYRLVDLPADGIDRSYGIFLGLLASLGIAYGGWTAMQEENTSFGDQADRLQNRGGGGTSGGGGGGTSGGGTPPPADRGSSTGGGGGGTSGGGTPPPADRGSSTGGGGGGTSGGGTPPPADRGSSTGGATGTTGGSPPPPGS